MIPTRTLGARVNTYDTVRQRHRQGNCHRTQGSSEPNLLHSASAVFNTLSGRSEGIMNKPWRSLLVVHHRRRLAAAQMLVIRGRGSRGSCCVHRIAFSGVYRGATWCGVRVGRPAVAAILVNRADLVGEGEASADVNVGDRHELRVHSLDLPLRISLPLLCDAKAARERGGQDGDRRENTI